MFNFYQIYLAVVEGLQEEDIGVSMPMLSMVL